MKANIYLSSGAILGLTPLLLPAPKYESACWPQPPLPLQGQKMQRSRAAPPEAYQTALGWSAVGYNKGRVSQWNITSRPKNVEIWKYYRLRDRSVEVKAQLSSKQRNFQEQKFSSV